MNSVESSLDGMFQSLKQLCPSFLPCILPHKAVNIETVLGLSSKQLAQWKKLETKYKDVSNNVGAQVIFHHNINATEHTINITNIQHVNDIDAQLYSVETIMRLLTVGEESELVILTNRFLELNNYSGDISSERHVFYNAYHLAYAIKIAIRNIPGFKVVLGSNTALPLDSKQNIEEILDKYILIPSKKDKKVVARSNDSDSDSDADSDNVQRNDKIVDSGLKKKKRKRGGGGAK